LQTLTANEISSDDGWRTMRKLAVLVIVSFLISGFAYLVCSWTTIGHSVGIVLVEGMDERIGHAIIEGFSEHEDHLEPLLLNYRFDDSQVRMSGNFKLVSDHFKYLDIDSIRDSYDVDIVLIVTTEMILDWDDSNKAYWGKAHTNESAALMTIHYWKGFTEENISRWQHIAVHEVLHLFGYTHNAWNRQGIMQYASNPTETGLVPYYDFQFPIRSALYPMTQGMSFRSVILVMNLAIAFFMLPIVFFWELMVTRVHKELTDRDRMPRWLGPLTITGGFFLLLAVTGSFIVIVFTLLFSILTHMVYHYLTKIKHKAAMKTDI
jgi:hypothetical protein